MDSLREIWAEEGPEKIISWYMESDRPAAELTDEERSWVALAFAMRGWNEEAIEMADQIEEDSAQGKCARAMALWGLERREEAIQALRRSLEIEDHLGRKEMLADYLVENAKLDGAGKFDPYESNKMPFPKPWPDAAYDYSHPRYNRPKELLWDCLEMGEPQSGIVQRAAVRLAQLGTSEEEVVEVLRRGTEKGSPRSRFELAAVSSYLSSESQEELGTDEIHWPKAWEIFQEAGENEVGTQEEKSVEGEKGGIFEAYVEFAALAAQQDENSMDGNREYPGRFYELGLRLMSQADALEVSREEIAVLCGRAAALSGDLEIGAMFYEEASETSSAVGETTAQIEEAVLHLRLAEKESQVVTNGRTDLLQKIVRASEQVLDRRFEDLEVDHVIGIKSHVVGHYTTAISVLNAPLLEEAISRVAESDRFEREIEGVVQAACARVLSGPYGQIRIEKEEKWRDRNFSEGALKCDHPGLSSTRRSIAIAQGRYGKALVESARSLSRRSENKEEIQNRAHHKFRKVRKNVFRELDGEAPELTARLPPDVQTAPHEQPLKKRKERFEKSHQRIQAFVEGEEYLGEIEEAYRPPILKEVCLQWEPVVKKGPFEETWERLNEAARTMLTVGDQKGTEEEQTVWVLGTALKYDAMLSRDISDRKAWAEQRSRLKSARMIDTPLQAIATAKHAWTCKALGDLDEAERALGRLGPEAKETVQEHVDVGQLKSQIDRLKTARDRWPDLGYYPKKLLATLTAVDGEFSVEDLADLSGQRQRYIESNVRDLLDEGMLASSPAVGPIWIEGTGGVRVNPHVEALARRERSHEVESRIIETDEDLKAKQVFDSDGEYEIYRTLTETFPNALVFPNMSPSAIFDYDEMKEALTGGEFKYFLQSRVDFCIVSTGSYLPILAIEVDSHYHDQDEQKKRDEKKDKIFRVGGVPLIRLRRYGDQSNEAVASQVQEKIQELIELGTEEAKILRIAEVDLQAQLD